MTFEKDKAPRITEDRIKDVIVDTDYHIFKGTELTVCCVTLQNGFTVTGESACASPENFDLQKGMDIAYKKAVDKIWLLEGYLLKQRLYEGDPSCESLVDET